MAQEATRVPNGVTVLLGRVLFSSIFLLAGSNHFSKQTIAFAASQGVPLASVAVPLSGILALAGGLSILLGYRAKVGAWLIALFLIPVSLTMHQFWAVHDPMMAQLQVVMFHEKCRHARGRIANFAVRGGTVESRCSPLAVSLMAWGESGNEENEHAQNCNCDRQHAAGPQQ